MFDFSLCEGYNDNIMNAGDMQMDYEEIYKSIPSLWNDTAVAGWSFFSEFRSEWERVLKKALKDDTIFLEESSEAVTIIPLKFCGIETEFKLDRSKMIDWYNKETQRGKRVVFYPERLKREGSGKLSYNGISCTYNPKSIEPEIPEGSKLVFACAVPSVPVEMRVIYGNSCVENQVNPFMRKKISLLRIPTDYIPAFLATPFEICLYLFFMDYCILKEDAGKVKDEEMKPLLHIFRPSPMLALKKLL